MKNFYKILSVTIFAVTFFAQSSMAQDQEFLVQIKDHKFTPDKVIVPANQKFKLVVENQDATAEEFESSDLRKEKVIRGGKKITMDFNGLKPGTYKFFGEFHPKTAIGEIVSQ